MYDNRMEREKFMKIMFAAPTYWPSQEGVAHVTKYLAEGLANKGHEILVFTSSGNGGLDPLPKQEIHEKVKIERMRVYVRWPLKLKGRDKDSTRQKYYEKIVSWQPDVLIVVCTQTWTFDWLIPYLQKLQCAKVFYSHGYSAWKESYPIAEKLKHRNVLGVYEIWKMKRYYDKLKAILPKYDLAIYLSEKDNSYLYAQRYHLTNGMILENAIEDRFFDGDMRHTEKKEHSDGIQFLYVANYNDNKNQQMLLQAYSMADIGKSRLVFVGFDENEYLQMLQKQKRELLDQQKNKEVFFGIRLPRNEIYDLYRDSDVFVCASKSESMSLVTCEAAATGMPIITTGVGITAQIDGTLLINTVEEMKAAIEQVYYNADERAERGCKSRQWIISGNFKITDKVNVLEKALEQFV